MDLCLTVLKPEPENDPPDQMFLLAPTVLQKENIQVRKCIKPPLTLFFFVLFSLNVFLTSTLTDFCDIFLLISGEQTDDGTACSKY